MICVLRGIQLNLLLINGSGSGTSGRATEFGLGRLGLNPRTDLGFFQFRSAVNLLSLGVGLFLLTCNRTVHTLPSLSFLLPTIIMYHLSNVILHCSKKRGKIQIEDHIF